MGIYRDSMTLLRAKITKWRNGEIAIDDLRQCVGATALEIVSVEENDIRRRLMHLEARLDELAFVTPKGGKEKALDEIAGELQEIADEYLAPSI